LEGLEPKWLLAGERIIGTELADRINVDQSPFGEIVIVMNQVEVWRGSDPGSRLTILARGGDDQISIDPSVLASFEISGGSGNDTILSGRGNDRLRGDDGDDLLAGGGGDDDIRGGLGNDRIFGDDVFGEQEGFPNTSFDGDDVVSGGPGADEIHGGSGDDFLDGEDGDDSLFGNKGNDHLLGGTGNDLVRGGQGDDFVDGGAGDDSVYGDAHDDRVYGGPGNDELAGDNPDFKDLEPLPFSDSLATYGVVHHYSFDGDFGDSTGSADGTPIGNSFADGTPLVGAASLRNVAGPGLNAVAINDAAPSFSSHTFSVALWFNAIDPTGLGLGQEGSFPRFLDADNGIGHFATGTRPLDETVFAEVNSTGQQNFTVGGTVGVGVAPPGTWNHAVLVNDRNNWRLFVNGVLRAQRDNIPALPPLTHATIGGLRLGINSPGDRDFNGLIDEVTIFDRALNSDEVSELFADPALIAKVTLNLGDDILNGGSGDDAYIASAGKDVIHDVDGRDSISFVNSSEVSLDLSSIDVQNLEGSGRTLQLLGTIEEFTGSGKNDDVRIAMPPNGESRVLDGAAGSDRLTVVVKDFRFTHGNGVLLFGDFPGSFIRYSNFESVDFVQAVEPTTIVVDSVKDVVDATDGETTLREAILAANENDAIRRIIFRIGCPLGSICLFTNPPPTYTISPTSPLPAITSRVEIDATTEAAYPGKPAVELDGSSAGSSADGLVLSDHFGSVVKGLAINRFSRGIVIEGGGFHWLASNFIGTDPSGTVDLGNRASGLRIAGSHFNAVGTNGDGVDDAQERNVISGNTLSGIVLTNASDNIIAGNYIGVDATGTTSMQNGNLGVWLTEGSTHNLIGTNGDGVSDTIERNVISGNRFQGIGIFQQGTNANRVAGNFIGADATGTSAVGNGNNGIWVNDGPRFTLVGTDGDGQRDDAERNVISGNAFSAVTISAGSNQNAVAGNYLGTDVTGMLAIPNGEQGVHIIDSAANRIGTNGDGVSDAIELNVISGNSIHGVRIIGAASVSNTVAGNLIGTDASGKQRLGNGATGVLIRSGASETRIGTNGDGLSDLTERNIISANGTEGVLLLDGGTNNNVVAGNLIGMDITGTVRMGNGLQGLEIRGGASGNRVGTDGDGLADERERNVISANGGSGVQIADSPNNIVAGNYIGMDITGTRDFGTDNRGVLIGGILSRGNRIGTNGDGIADATERNVISGNDSAGVELDGASNNIVAGNFIGTDATGKVVLGNGGGGVLLNNGAQGNTIGGGLPAARNVISGNHGSGVVVTGSGTSNNVVAGNSIGLALDGSPLGNALHGVVISSFAQGNLVGTTSNRQLASRVIDFSSQYSTGSWSAAQVLGPPNTLTYGDRPTAWAPMAANGTLEFLTLGFETPVYAQGVVVRETWGNGFVTRVDVLDLNDQLHQVWAGVDPSQPGAPAEFVAQWPTTPFLVKGVKIHVNTNHNLSTWEEIDAVALLGFLETPGLGNTIAFNGRAGVLIATDSANNQVSRNSIHDNGGLGIDLEGDGPTANDLGDADSGANRLQNHPTLSGTRSGSTTRVAGSLNSSPNSFFTVEFFANKSPDSSGYGEGRRPLGSIHVVTDQSGNAKFTATLSAPTTADELITATAADLGGNTSEFSAAVGVDATRPTSRVNTLPQRSDRLAFEVTVAGSDPGTPSTGVDRYDVFASANGQPFAYWATLPGDDPRGVFVGESNRSYAFYSIAHDAVGNTEQKSPRIEASTYLPDLDAPQTQVDLVDAATSTFEVRFSGRDTGGSGLAAFEIFVQIDGQTATSIAVVNAGLPGAGGTHSGSGTFQAIADGQSHTYRFYSVGRDGNGNVESPPIDPARDALLSAVFDAPASLAVTAFDVQRGAKQRSFIRYLDLTFNSADGVNDLISSLNDGDATNDRVRLRRFDLDGGGAAEMVPLQGVLDFRAVDQVMQFDFGIQGIGGNRNSGFGDGYYLLDLDLDGDVSNGWETELRFYRLFGDVSGNRIVDNLDLSAISIALGRAGANLEEDVNGDGVVNQVDRILAARSLGRRLAASLILDD